MNEWIKITSTEGPVHGTKKQSDAMTEEESDLKQVLCWYSSF